MIRRISSSNDLSHEMRLPQRKPSAQNIDIHFVSNTTTMERLLRQKTFLVDKRASPNNEEMVSSREGIATILELLPSNLKPYISMHFLMIREENEDLLQLLEEKEGALEKLKEVHAKCQENEKTSYELKKCLKHVTSQYEREKFKTRAILRRLKLSKKHNQSLETDNDLIWYGIDSSCGDSSRKVANLTHEEENSATQSNPLRQTFARYQHRSTQTIEQLPFQIKEENEKLFNKTKSYKAQIHSMKTEMGSLKKVSRHSSKICVIKEGRQK